MRGDFALIVFFSFLIFSRSGMGLGLPDLKPGLADKMQLNKAKSESDQYADEMELERVLKESKAEFSGARDDELQRVLKESSMDYVSN